MNIGLKVVWIISNLMDIDKSDIEARSKFDEDLGMDDSDVEDVLDDLEQVLEVDLIDFFDPSEVKTVGQLVRFIREKMEM